MNRKTALAETYLPTYFFNEKVGKDLDILSILQKMKKAGEPIEIHERFLKRGYKPQSYIETPFKGVINMPMDKKIPKKQLDLLKPQEALPLNFDGYVKEIKAAIKRYLVKVWNSEKPKLFLHSAGYDSRIISGCLMELREEKGDEWIGDIHFRCHQPEAEMFIEIMKRQGWKKEQYSLWEDFKGPDDHYNLGRIEYVNGFMGHIQQYDFFSDYVKGREKDIIIIGGIYGGELFDYPSRNKKHFKTFKYCENEWLRSLHNYMIHEGGTVSKYFNDHNYAIFPYLSYEYLKVATTIPKRFVGRDHSKGPGYPDNIRLAILRTFNVDLVSIPYGFHKYTWNTTKKTHENMQKFYDQSQFKKDFKINVQIPFKNNTYEDKMWTLAVLYDTVKKSK